MLIPSSKFNVNMLSTSLSRRVNANSQLAGSERARLSKLIKKGEC